MTDSFLTSAELSSLKSHRRTPYVIRGVSQTQFSVARHYGGCTINDETYVYQPVTDELIRDDVLAEVMRMRKKSKKVKQAKASEM